MKLTQIFCPERRCFNNTGLGSCVADTVKLLDNDDFGFDCETYKIDDRESKCNIIGHSKNTEFEDTPLGVPAKMVRIYCRYCNKSFQKF